MSAASAREELVALRHPDGGWLGITPRMADILIAAGYVRIDPDDRATRERALAAWFEAERGAHPASTLGDRMAAALRAVTQ